jgi:hypothetical protein
MRKIGLTILLALALTASFAQTQLEAVHASDMDVAAPPSSKSPMFSVSPTSLTGFYYSEGSYTIPQTFVITGSGLQGKTIKVDSSASQFYGVFNYDYSEDNPFTIYIPADADGNLNATIYTALLDGLPEGEYTGNVTVGLYPPEQGIADQYVYCSGTVGPRQKYEYLADFEKDGEVKPDYECGIVTLNGIQWEMKDALIETDTNYVIEGARSANLKGSVISSMTMLEDKPYGCGRIYFNHRSYGSDTQVPWVVEYSLDSGNTWTQAGNAFTATSTLGEYFYWIITTKDTRFRIKRASADPSTDNHRLIIDNIQITDCYDFADGQSYEVGSEGQYQFGLTGGNANYSTTSTPSPVPNNNFTVVWHECLTLIGCGPWNFFTADTSTLPPLRNVHWAAVKYDDVWHTYEMVNGRAFFQIPEPSPGPNREIEVILGYGGTPTVPVTLSHFSATMTAENYVNLKWISQTETGLMGYNVLRSAEEDLSSASQICAMIAATNSSEAHAYSYLDKDLVEDGTYYYWLQSVEMDGTTNFHGPASVVFSITGDSGSPSIPKVTKLEDAYPNPFNPNTTLRYQLESPGKVKIDIYNTRGQIVRSFSQSHDAAGYYSILWDGCDSNGRALASGVYLYRMTSGSYAGVKKMVLQK